VSSPTKDENSIFGVMDGKDPWILAGAGMDGKE
jgi:hypothetical protein